ncbi:MAG: branched-chain amino acid ABC transporter substrate-binding protein [Anaerolineae bacterium]
MWFNRRGGGARFLLFLLAAAALSACLEPEISCADVLGCVEVRANETIRIAALLPMSGGGVPLGTLARGGIDLAIADRGDSMLNHQIELTLYDSACRPDTAQAAADVIAADSRVVGVVGTICADAARPAAARLSSAGLTMISPANSASDLTDPDSRRPGYFRTAVSLTAQGQAAARFAFNELSARSAAIIYDNSEYADELQTAFVATFQNLGGSITYRSRRQIELTTVAGLLNSVKLGRPEVLYLPLFAPEAGLLVNKIQEVPDLAATAVLGPDSLFLPEFALSAGSATAGMYVSGAAVSGPDYEDFLARWEVQFGQRPAAADALIAPFAYDAANLLFTAVEQAAQVDSAGRLLIGRAALRQALTDMKPMLGLTGSLACDTFGDCAAGTAVGIYQFSEAEARGEQWPPLLVWPPPGRDDAAR